ncbi:MAG: 16S rRNA (cytidine(1402)-2'-O)-methyltransferase [SAR86 cluster bacterium]|uniref:Ribosomal RNA small subunit methyltransferase I n=1 Tax=SAR86 cluster bacterium TaxID=2030880 RepID=A0A520N4N3_9GAMM|nr:MAG: 16S rRNA (cytidine(1402)-2'-O)-methyltransferase [SAR86 cluster bacterium]
MLYFISTPIGNLNDISLRAIDVIRSSDYLYAEDTRNIKKLLNFINFKVKSKSFHEHNEHRVSLKIIENLKNGNIVSIVSDAGTPIVSDPGYKLIQICLKENIKYTLIPGPSSVLSSLVMSGLSPDRFSFYGFIPRKAGDQNRFFEALSNDEKTSIVFESPKRIKKTLINLQKFLGKNRKISLCKEMTKIHEDVFRGKISEIIKDIENDQINLKGELVLVIEGANNKIDLNIDMQIKKEFLSKLSASDSAKLISMLTGKNKRDIYKKLIEK